MPGTGKSGMNHTVQPPATHSSSPLHRKALAAWPTLGLAALACLPLLISLRAAEASESIFTGTDDAILVDHIVCATDAAHDFAEYPADASRIETILGKACRVLAPEDGQPKYFAYRIGPGGRLSAGKAYLLQVRYPEDQPRSMFILNRGCETTRGFHTGRTVGDALHTPYVSSNAESLELPLSGGIETWESLFFLHDRFPGLKQPRDQEFPRDNLPEDGFWLIIAQLSRENAPLSHGAAIRDIRLYEIFFREEMSDGLIQSSNPEERGVDLDRTWYENKIRLCAILGIDTFAKDLLEFGANQGWDPSKYGGNRWVHFAGDKRQRWSEIVQLCGQFGLNVMPYYEYCGSKGGEDSLGYQRRARPLGDRREYTHISWTESANADLTDPDTFEDLRRMLDITVVDEAEIAEFIGIWLRPRPSQLPISFSDAAISRFQNELDLDLEVSRTLLSEDEDLYTRYRDWWMEQRLGFLQRVQRYLEKAVGSPQVVLYTTDSSEPGIPLRGPDKPEVVAENLEPWKSIPARAASLQDVIDRQLHFKALTEPYPTWGGWEWQHAVPEADPHRYTEESGVSLTYTYNRMYTVARPKPLDAFRSRAGLAMIRHFSLNEDAFAKDEDNRILGYFVSDMEPAGPFCMMAEATAVANGDPFYLGYLSSNSFNTGFPQYMRTFHQNYLALPALPSRHMDHLALDPDLVLRLIDAGVAGEFLAAIHLGREWQDDLRFRLPEPGRLFDAVSGEELDVLESDLVSLPYYPFQLRSFRFFPNSRSFAPEIELHAPGKPLSWHALPQASLVRTFVSANVRDWDGKDGEHLTVKWNIEPAEHAEILQADLNGAEVLIRAPGKFKVSVSAVDPSGNQANASASISVEQREEQIAILPGMITEECSWSAGCNLFDEQEFVGNPPSGRPQTLWEKKEWRFPLAVTIDLGFQRELTRAVWFDANGIGQFRISTGKPGHWQEAATVKTDAYQTWAETGLSASTRYLRLEMLDGGANIAEFTLFGRW
jgi:hypothetical protein